MLDSPPQPDDAHVLIVDDNPDELRLLIEILRGAGLRISVAFDGAQGYHRAVSSVPDLILMDVFMPRMNGLVACRLLKADSVTAAIPVIFLSAAASPEERVQGLEEGGVDYVLKPFVPAEVLARVRIHLDLARRPVAAPVKPAQPAPPVANDEDHVLVRAATRYLRVNLSEPHTLDAVARAVGTHEKRLSQAFRQHLGMSVFQFLREERVREASRLLTRTSLSVGAIAAEMGFSSAANFATAFRERTGVTPTAFRLGQVAVEEKS